MVEQSPSGREAPGPLSGLRVLELGNFIAAPSAGHLMADFGADVIKVERPLAETSCAGGGSMKERPPCCSA